MTKTTFIRSLTLLALLCALFAAGASRAQSPAAAEQPKPSPLPGKCESPEEIAARVHYERALRAELDGNSLEARREAEATLFAQPTGSFADATHALLLRLGRPAPLQPAAPAVTSAGVRSELIIASTLDGLYLSSLLAYAGGFDSKGTVAALMVGTGGALAASIALSSGRAVPRSMPALIELGTAYGTFATLLGENIGGTEDGRRIAGGVLAGAAAGTLGGILVSPYLSSGDAGAATAGLIYGAALPLLIEGSVSTTLHEYVPQWTLLIGGTVGLIGVPLLNRELGFSRARWNLITLGGGVGALFGFGGAYLLGATDANDQRGYIAIGLLGTVSGLVLTTFLTHEFDEEPRESHALVHFQPGQGLSPGSLASAIAPVLQDGRTGVQLNALDARF